MKDYNLTWTYTVSIEIKAANEDKAQEKADGIYEYLELTLANESKAPANIRKYLKEASIDNDDQNIEEL